MSIYNFTIMFNSNEFEGSVEYEATYSHVAKDTGQTEGQRLDIDWDSLTFVYALAHIEPSTMLQFMDKLKEQIRDQVTFEQAKREEE